MANRTIGDADPIKGTNPQYLVEKILRSRIYDSKYWKEECFALTAELLVDKAMELKYIGGVFGANVQPTPFICLVLKMLQIQPEKDIIVEFMKNDDFKYVRALGALYMRIVGTSLDCFNYLEPLYNDYRKLKRQKRDGVFELVPIDDFIDELLHEERVCDVILPRIQKRYILEEKNLGPRVSLLDDIYDRRRDDEDVKDSKLKASSKKWKGYTDHGCAQSSASLKCQGTQTPHNRKGESPSGRQWEPRSSSSREHVRPRSRSPTEHCHKHDRDDRRNGRSNKRSRSDQRVDKVKSRSRSGGNGVDQEIAESNALRRKLSRKPLRT